MQKPFVVISGLPASGKTSLARRLVPALDLPLIDKDDILDRLFELKGIGDAAWRRTLSRESDRILQQEAENSSGAILVSFWRVPGMPQESGTPADWLHAPSHHLVNVHCVCEPEIAALRFVRRVRHPGHLDRRILHGRPEPTSSSHVSGDSRSREADSDRHVRGAKYRGRHSRHSHVRLKPDTARQGAMGIQLAP